MNDRRIKTMINSQDYGEKVWFIFNRCGNPTNMYGWFLVKDKYGKTRIRTNRYSRWSGERETFPLQISCATKDKKEFIESLKEYTGELKAILELSASEEERMELVDES